MSKQIAVILGHHDTTFSVMGLMGRGDVVIPYTVESDWYSRISDKTRFDAVVLDFEDGNWREVATKLKDLKPDIKIIGYSKNVQVLEEMQKAQAEGLLSGLANKLPNMRESQGKAGHELLREAVDLAFASTEIKA